MIGGATIQVQRSFLDDHRKLSFTMLDLRKLRLLRELHARGTVAAVAEALAYTPSAVSQQLAALQAEAGVPLTERIGRRLRLTEAGVRLVEHADALLGRLEEAEADLQSAAGTVGGTLRVASLPTPLISVVPVANATLAVRYPGLRVELTEMEPEDALPALSLGEIDAAIAEEYDFAPRPVRPDLDKEELGGDEVLVAVPRDHPAAERPGPISLRSLAGDPWVNAHEDTRFAEMVVGACRLAGFEPDIRHRCNDAQIEMALIASGACVGLVPSLARPDRYEGVVTRSVADFDLHRTVYVFTRRSGRRRPSLEALTAALREGARDHLTPPGGVRPTSRRRGT
jgi:DNA-binding transcriptional LysR family regulator